MSRSKVVFLKVLFDFLGAMAALGLAFATRTFFSPTHLNDVQTQYFLFYGAITVLSMAAFGFYKSGASRPDRSIRPMLILAGASAAPIIWSLLMYFGYKQPFFPRIVTLLTWAYSLALLGLPRLIKYYVQNNIVLQVVTHNKRKVRNILVIGGAGYIGSQLVRDLLLKGYFVRVLDSMMFGDFSLSDVESNKNLDLVRGDFRNVESVARAMRGMDAVVHLGGIVGDPACALDDDFTTDINLTATMMLAEICKVFKIQRFVFASTCSVYGKSDGDNKLTEESPLNPVSLYAKTKIASEKVLLDIATPEFQPTILRFATLFGLSSRPRFDLIVNLLTAKAVQENKITVFGGDQWRPFAHIKDLSFVIQKVIEAPLNKVGKQVFNVGSDEENYKIIDIGNLVKKHVPQAELLVDNDSIDARNYKVSFDKLKGIIGPHRFVTVDEGIIEIRDAFLKNQLSHYTDPKYSNVVQTRQALTVQTDLSLRQTAKSILSGISNN